MKKRITSYTFNAASKTVTSSSFSTLEGILLITNVTDGIIIYSFADPAKGGTLSGTTLTLEYDTTSMSNTDALQIFVDVPEATEKTFNDILDTLYDVSQALTAILAMRETNASLRTAITSGSVGVSSLPTLATVTTVGTLNNMSTMGNIPALNIPGNLQNMAAIESNINNVSG